MEVEVYNRKEDYLAFFNHIYFKRIIGRNIWFSFFVALIVIGGQYSITSGQTEGDNFPEALIIVSMVLAVTTLLPYFFSIRKLESLIGTNKTPLGRKKFTITDTGIQVESETRNNFWDWFHIQYVDASDKHVFFYLFTGEVYILPVKYFDSEQDVENFIGTIQNGLNKVKNIMTPRKVRQQYWWGLLGFIPLIGAIAGLVLLLKGIFNDKDKYLIIIGTLCILYTIAFYAYKW